MEGVSELPLHGGGVEAPELVVVLAVCRAACERGGNEEKPSVQTQGAASCGDEVTRGGSCQRCVGCGLGQQQSVASPHARLKRVKRVARTVDEEARVGGGQSERAVAGATLRWIQIMRHTDEIAVDDLLNTRAPA